MGSPEGGVRVGYEGVRCRASGWPAGRHRRHTADIVGSPEGGGCQSRVRGREMSGFRVARSSSASHNAHHRVSEGDQHWRSSRGVREGVSEGYEGASEVTPAC